MSDRSMTPASETRAESTMAGIESTIDILATQAERIKNIMISLKSSMFGATPTTEVTEKQLQPIGKLADQPLAIRLRNRLTDLAKQLDTLENTIDNFSRECL
jgi:hypothetical protein